MNPGIKSIVNNGMIEIEMHQIVLVKSVSTLFWTSAELNEFLINNIVITHVI